MEVEFDPLANFYARILVFFKAALQLSLEALFIVSAAKLIHLEQTISNAVPIMVLRFTIQTNTIHNRI